MLRNVRQTVTNNSPSKNCSHLYRPTRHITEACGLNPINILMLAFCFSPQAEGNMKKYGKSLVNAVPDEATKLLKVLCTDYRPQSALESES